MKKIMKSKEGISPMIATVLLIGFIIAIIVLIFLWGKNYIEELAEKRGLLAEKQQQCTSVQLEVVKACWRGGEVQELVIRNRGSAPIHKFIFSANGREGDTAESAGASAKLGGLETKAYTGIVFSTPSIDTIDIIPHLRVAPGHYVPCSKQKVTAQVYCPEQ